MKGLVPENRLAVNVLCYWLYHHLYNYFATNIYVSSKNEGANLIKIVQPFDFHFILKCLKAFKVLTLKLSEQVL